MTLKYGLPLAKSIGCNCLIINLDNMEVTETLKNGASFAGAAAATFDDFYHMSCEFPHVLFEHEEDNGVAHE